MELHANTHPDPLHDPQRRQEARPHPQRIDRRKQQVPAPLRFIPRPDTMDRLHPARHVRAHDATGGIHGLSDRWKGQVP